VLGKHSKDEISMNRRSGINNGFIAPDVLMEAFDQRLAIGYALKISNYTCEALSQ
jgi:hypothetical protein